MAVLKLHVKRLPPKIHSVCAHLEAWCKLAGGCNQYTDEWIERSHQDFRALWESSFQVHDITSEMFQERHLRAVLRFNSSNLPFEAAAALVKEEE